ncbi:hypothetical protein HYH03_001203 [Edaphochlamys debaryana]|uniref:Protein kinase domain-containing protein n=1 Tax=Edaphochlamys debaryana TaxID=47281 RepID=A0A835YEL2_9CHLO|nr:hypothetical protein HYH03_001203 [Edaphochlamys debaryana]|eukprot:KAG2501420.1 hypothetical protein HYH03_001203 [Edaphochlamys debaryana]
MAVLSRKASCAAPWQQTVVIRNLRLTGVLLPTSPYPLPASSFVVPSALRLPPRGSAPSSASPPPPLELSNVLLSTPSCAALFIHQTLACSAAPSPNFTVTPSALVVHRYTSPAADLTNVTLVCVGRPAPYPCLASVADTGADALASIQAMQAAVAKFVNDSGGTSGVLPVSNLYLAHDMGFEAGSSPFQLSVGRLVIAGAADGSTILDLAGTSSLFTVSSDASVQLHNLTLANPPVGPLSESPWRLLRLPLWTFSFRRRLFGSVTEPQLLTHAVTVRDIPPEEMAAYFMDLDSVDGPDLQYDLAPHTGSPRKTPDLVPPALAPCFCIWTNELLTLYGRPERGAQNGMYISVAKTYSGRLILKNTRLVTASSGAGGAHGSCQSSPLCKLIPAPLRQRDYFSWQLGLLSTLRIPTLTLNVLDFPEMRLPGSEYVQLGSQVVTLAVLSAETAPTKLAAVLRVRVTRAVSLASDPLAASVLDMSYLQSVIWIRGFNGSISLEYLVLVGLPSALDAGSNAAGTGGVAAAPQAPTEGLAPFLANLTSCLWSMDFDRVNATPPEQRSTDLPYVSLDSVVLLVPQPKLALLAWAWALGSRAGGADEAAAALAAVTSDAGLAGELAAMALRSRLEPDSAAAALVAATIASSSLSTPDTALGAFAATTSVTFATLSWCGLVGRNVILASQLPPSLKGLALAGGLAPDRLQAPALGLPWAWAWHPATTLLPAQPTRPPMTPPPPADLPTLAPQLVAESPSQETATLVAAPSPSSAVPTGAIVGAVVGGVAAAALASVGAVLVLHLRKRRQPPADARPIARPISKSSCSGIGHMAGTASLSRQCSEGGGADGGSVPGAPPIPAAAAAPDVKRATDSILLTGRQGSFRNSFLALLLTGKGSRGSISAGAEPSGPCHGSGCGAAQHDGSTLLNGVAATAATAGMTTDLEPQQQEQSCSERSLDRGRSVLALAAVLSTSTQSAFGKPGCSGRGNDTGGGPSTPASARKAPASASGIRKQLAQLYGAVGEKQLTVNIVSSANANTCAGADLLLASNATNSTSGSMPNSGALGIRTAESSLRGVETSYNDAVLVISGELGRGAQGVVYRGTWRGLPVAVKSMLLQCDGGGGRERVRRAIQEAAISASVSQPHVVATYTHLLQRMGAEDGFGPSSAPAPATGSDLQLSSDTRSSRILATQQGAELQVWKLTLVQELCDATSVRVCLDNGALARCRSVPQQPAPQPSVRILRIPGSSCSGGATSGAGSTASTDWAPVVLPALQRAWHPEEPVPPSEGLLYPRVALSVALHAARGLAHLHSLGIVHGDVSSSNILLQSARPRQLPAPTSMSGAAGAATAGQPGSAGLGAERDAHGFGYVAKVCDFGSSGRLDAAGEQTHLTGPARRSSAYSAPELVRSGHAGPSGDVYALALVAWELAWGASLPSLLSRPEGSGLQAWLTQQALADPAEATALPPGLLPWPPHLPPALHELAAACLREAAAGRPKMAEVCQRLEGMLG